MLFDEDDDDDDDDDTTHASYTCTIIYREREGERKSELQSKSVLI